MSNYLNRHLNLLDFSLGSLKRRWLKSFGVFVVFMAVIFFLASFQLFSNGLQSITDRLLLTVPDITVQQMSAGRQVPLPVSIKNELKTVYGIASVRERIWGYYFDESNGANYTVVGIDKENIEEYMRESLSFLEGEIDSGKIIIGAGVRDSLGLGTRKFFTLFRPDLSQQSFETTAVFDDNLSVLTSDMILMTKEDARNLFQMDKDHITDLLINAANPVEIDNMARTISEKTVGTRVLTKEQIKKTYRAVFGWRSGVGAIALAGGIIAFMILAWDRVSGLSQGERRQTAILKGVGFQSEDMMLIRFYEAFGLSIISFLFGTTLAWIHILFFDGILFKPLLLGWSVLRPEFSIHPQFNLADLLLVFCLSVVPYWCATIVPAWRSAMIRADSVV